MFRSATAVKQRQFCRGRKAVHTRTVIFRPIQAMTRSIPISTIIYLPLWLPTIASLSMIWASDFASEK